MNIKDFLDWNFRRKIGYSKLALRWFKDNVKKDSEDPASVLNRYEMKVSEDLEVVYFDMAIPENVLASCETYEDKLEYVKKEAEKREEVYFIKELGIDGSLLHKDIVNFTNESGELSDVFGVMYTLDLPYLEKDYFTRQVVSWSVLALLTLSVIGVWLWMLLR